MAQNETRIAAEIMARRDVFELCARGFLARRIAAATALIGNALKGGGKMLVFGNGGSAAEAQHFAAELVGRFERDRRALPAIALTTDTSILTAQANDAGYATVFSRQIEALGRAGDVVVGMTTSDVSPDHSENIRMGFLAARAAGCGSVGFFSEKTNTLLSLVDVPLIVPERNTALIQEVHLAIIHIISKLVEQEVS